MVIKNKVVPLHSQINSINENNKIMKSNNFSYKVTYLSYCMAVAFVRIADNAILYQNEKEDNVIEYALNSGKAFFVE